MAVNQELRAAITWKRWRQKNLLSQASFAMALGVTERTIRNIEHGVHEPNWINQKRFEDLKERYRKAGKR
jgi:DNA-binding XRE family transcriptional regulator